MYKRLFVNSSFHVLVIWLTRDWILFANANDKPFHAISGAHATTTYLNNITNAVGIFLRGMNDIFIVDDGDTALIQGGILNGDVTDFLWAHDKQTMTTACACVGYISPILGGGHGWNQGRYGLASDQLVSARMVLANGTAITVNESSPNLFWAIRGAGHNFGIFTQAEIKIYDKKPNADQWAVSGYFYTHDKMEDVVSVANTWITSANRSVSLEHYVVFSFDPVVDPVNVGFYRLLYSYLAIANIKSQSSSSGSSTKAPIPFQHNTPTLSSHSRPFPPTQA
jgi:FAD/FMN-containing dehydrogenase